MVLDTRFDDFPDLPFRANSPSALLATPDLFCFCFPACGAGDVILSVDPRQRVHRNGTLYVHTVDKAFDDYEDCYTRSARNDRSETDSGSVYTCMSASKVTPLGLKSMKILSSYTWETILSDCRRFRDFHSVMFPLTL
jgi:hypothetical protein